MSDNNSFDYEYDPTNLFDTKDDLDEYQYYKGCSPVPYKSNETYNYTGSDNLVGDFDYEEITLEELEEMYESGEIDEDTYNSIMSQVESFEKSNQEATNVYSGLANVYTALARLFGMSSSNCSDYNLAHDETRDWCVDTCEVDEEEFGYKYETAVAHLDFNHGNYVIVQSANTEESALEVHSKWVNDLKKNKIDLLVDINTLEVFKRKKKGSNDNK